VGHGCRNRLLYNDLDIYKFVQVAFQLSSNTLDVAVMRLMLAQLRSTMCDASFHGFDSARYSYGIVLSMLEDGALKVPAGSVERDGCASICDMLLASSASQSCIT
jgi:hypothetical protein